MRSEYTRQTRWAHAPEPADAGRTPPGDPYVKQVVWLPCTQCDLQVHASVTQLLSNGISCPECGRRLAEPMGHEASPGAVAPVLDLEERFRQELAREET
jgi:hypothetical protein